MSSVDALLREADALPVSGWDFSALGGRIAVAPLPWDFDSIVAAHARDARDLLDLGTGGGEWLASLPVRPAVTVATESWQPNVEVARRRLRPLGVEVVATEAAPDNVEQQAGDERGRLPFPDDSFSLVTSRHESFVAAEVERVLRSDGTFLTQQVGGDYGDFYNALELVPPPARQSGWRLPLAVAQLAAAGLRVVESAEATEATSFEDVGAFAWYLRMIPWTVPGFSIATHRVPLERLQQRIETDGPLHVRLPAFWLKALKPA